MSEPVRFHYGPKFDGWPIRRDDYETRWFCNCCREWHIYLLKNVCLGNDLDYLELRNEDRP